MLGVPSTCFSIRKSSILAVVLDFLLLHYSHNLLTNRCLRCPLAYASEPLNIGGPLPLGVIGKSGCFNEGVA
jgi:hypothetical protein